MPCLFGYPDNITPEMKFIPSLPSSSFPLDHFLLFTVPVPAPTFWNVDMTKLLLKVTDLYVHCMILLQPSGSFLFCSLWFRGTNIKLVLH